MATESFRAKSHDNTELYGLLELPVSSPPFPAVLLIQGSGPTDMNGNSPFVATPINTLSDIAGDLARAGVASIRFDKRGVGKSIGQLPKNTGDYSTYFSWDNYVEDVADIYRTLRGNPKIDSNRVAVLGHSEGGLLALRLCQKMPATEQPKAIVLAAAPGRPLDVILGEQLAAPGGMESFIALIDGAKVGHPVSAVPLPPADLKAMLQENQRLMTAIKNTGKVPPSTNPYLSVMYPAYLGLFWQQVTKSDPPILAHQLQQPVLLLQGEKDSQVSASRDLPVLASALQNRPHRVTEIALLPDLNHFFKKAMQGYAGPIESIALDSLKKFVRCHL